MSEVGHSRRFGHLPVTSGLPQSTDIATPGWLVRFVPIVLQKSKVATARFFRENLKRKEVDDLHSLSRTTEVAHEFGARR